MRGSLCAGLVAGLVLSVATAAIAETDAQFVFAGLRVPDDPNVGAFRFSLLYAEADRMEGFDLGFASLARSKDFHGFGPFLAAAYVTGKASGCLCSFLNVALGETTGLNMAFINALKKTREGANLAFVNYTEGASNVDISGLAISDASKVQVGFVNITKRIESVQIGFLNFAENGFLPVFPFVNYPKRK